MLLIKANTAVISATIIPDPKYKFFIPAVSAKTRITTTNTKNIVVITTDTMLENHNSFLQALSEQIC